MTHSGGIACAAQKWNRQTIPPRIQRPSRNVHFPGPERLWHRATGPVGFRTGAITAEDHERRGDWLTTDCRHPCPEEETTLQMDSGWSKKIFGLQANEWVRQGHRSWTFPP